MTVPLYWEGKAHLPMASIARTLAVWPTSGADVERLFTQARAALDYFMGGCKVGTMSDRLFVKGNRKMLKRLHIRIRANPSSDQQARAVINKTCLFQALRPHYGGAPRQEPARGGLPPGLVRRRTRTWLGRIAIHFPEFHYRTVSFRGHA